jgi:hypothetical protein
MTEHDEPPPFLGSWKRIYGLIVGYLLGLIGLFYWFTRSWNR